GGTFVASLGHRQLGQAEGPVELVVLLYKIAVDPLRIDLLQRLHGLVVIPLKDGGAGRIEIGWLVAERNSSNLVDRKLSRNAPVLERHLFLGHAVLKNG